MTERTIYRWRIDVGLAFHQEFAAVDRLTDEDWVDWSGWSLHLALADRDGAVVMTFDTGSTSGFGDGYFGEGLYGGSTGSITTTGSTINFDMPPAITADLTPTSTIGRGKEKAQLAGTFYAIDPIAPSEPYPLALVKCVVKEP